MPRLKTNQHLEETSLVRRNVVIFSDLLLPPSMTFIRSQGEALESFVPYYLGCRGVQTGGLSMPHERTTIINASGSLLGKLSEIPLKVFGYAPNTIQRISCVHPVLIHAHFGPGGAIVLPLALQMQIPLIITFHGYDVTVNDSFASKSTFTHRRFIRKRRALQKHGAKFIAVSEFVRRKLLEQNYPEEKVLRLYIGVDTHWFQPEKRVNRQPIVLFVGNLVENKGCEFAIRAMEEVQNSCPDAEFVVIGDGPLRRALELLARLKLRRFRFLGYRPPEQIREWMNRAKVFCVPSVEVESGASEGFGLVFAEAQSMEVPVASFATGGIPEVIADRETGLLAPPRDFRQLAANIHLLLTDSDLWARMGKTARERTVKMFELKSQTRLLEREYHKVLGSPSLFAAEPHSCQPEATCGGHV